MRTGWALAWLGELINSQGGEGRGGAGEGGRKWKTKGGMEMKEKTQLEEEVHRKSGFFRGRISFTVSCRETLVMFRFKVSFLQLVPPVP